MIQRADHGAPGSERSLGPGAARYTVHLEQFEGPLDLLLYLIQRDELDIYDIPIRHITKTYLSYIDLLDVFELDNAGEFLVMASTLMRIKARMLLPISRPEEDDEDGDPRAELVARLLEYKKFKEAAGELERSEAQRRDYHYRGQAFPFPVEDDEPPELSLSMFDLLGALRTVLEQVQQEGSHHVYTEVYTVQAQQEAIVSALARAEGKLRFTEVFTEMKVKMQVVVTFVAMLELMKAGRLRAQQNGPWDEIWLSEPPADEMPTDEAFAAEAAAGDNPPEDEDAS